MPKPNGTAIGLALTGVMVGAVTMASVATEQSAPAAPDPVVWDLTDLYPSVAAWRAAREDMTGRVADLARFRGTLGESAAHLADALDAVRGTEKELVRLYVYAFLAADEDRRVAEAQERRGRRRC